MVARNRATDIGFRIVVTHLARVGCVERPIVFSSTIRAHARVMAASLNGNNLTRVAFVKFANKRQGALVG